MNDAAAFQAVYTDWNLIKGRKVVRIGLEIPIEQADLAYQALGGMPNPAESAWVAVARLQNGAVERLGTREAAPPTAPEETSTQPPPARSYAFEAVRLCKSSGFQTWCQATWPDAWRLMNNGDMEGRARTIVIWQCGVQSRSELREGTEAGEKWKQLKLRYERPDLAA